eukprot:CAMPEP_0194415836 /NCGR_PEP_ID=MMETSP0176-20130528/14665_1 /TAXON_ID=216777 /ORGANISM="Proboscia alata, Strain PI-D3" /LENGTH=90 /DNA_ID=CAMNT_0039220727 /DNA_START=153 /DNA_END=421 /DNA_ORIENTATION=+
MTGGRGSETSNTSACMSEGDPRWPTGDDFSECSSYTYNGSDGEKVPKNAQNVEYAAGISTIKVNAAIRCCRVKSVIHPDSIIVIEDRAYR